MWRPALRGDWPEKLLTVSQICVGFVALLGVWSMITRRPILMLGFAFAQAILLLGIVLFGIVAATAQRAMNREQYDAGDVIIHQGDPRRDVYVISSGRVEIVVREPDGRERIDQSLGPGGHFGETALLGQGPYFGTARAVTPVTVVRMAPSTFLTLWSTLPGFKEQFTAVMQDRLRQLEARK